MKPRVLVAEDNPAMSALVDFTLQRAGYEVTVCNNGRKAIDALDSKEFDVLMTDFQMPGAYGDEVIRHARASELNSEITIFLCSAKGYEVDREMMTNEYRVAEIMTKPFSPSNVVKVFAQHVQLNAS